MERLFSIDHGIHRYQHCELTNLSYLTVKAVHVLKTVSDGQFNGSHSFGPSLLDGSPLDFARARTSRISLAGERDSGCGGGAVAYYSASSSTIVICPFAAKFEDAHLLAETIVHEARHADGHAHVRCARGSLTQTFGNACDERLSDLGSYAVSLEFAVGLSRHRLVPASIREESRLRATQYIKERFNARPGDLKDGAILKLRSGGLVFYDGIRATKLTDHSPSNSRPYLSSDGRLYLLSSQASEVFEYSDHEKLAASGKRFLPKMNPEQQRRFRDFVSIGKMRCILFTDSILCAGPDGFAKGKAIPLPARATKFMYSNQARRWFGLSTAEKTFVLAENGKAYPIPGIWSEFKSARSLEEPVEFSAAAAIPWPTRRLVPHILKLDSSGRLMLLEEDEDERPASGVADLDVVDVVGPFAWSPRLKDL